VSAGAIEAVWLVSAAIVAYLIGSIPFAYLIVRGVKGEDITRHGTGNVGSMNVRRTTGSWGWFAIAMVADGLKGLLPTAAAKFLATGMSLAALIRPVAQVPLAPALLVQGVVFGAVLGHNYSVWMALVERRFARTGKGLATGAGALLGYDWRYFLAVLVVGLLVIAATRYMMAGQVAAAAALPATALLTRSADWPFALLMGVIVYSAHHKRFIGMLRGREPKLYVDEGGGPRG
jgi:glycerol-3-phosphate acyltransferase PlsY